MDRITEYLEKLAAGLAELSDDELAALEAEGLDLFDAVKDGSVEVDDKLDTLRTLAAKVSDVQAEAAQRIDAALAEQAEIDAIELARPEATDEPAADEADETTTEPELVDETDGDEVAEVAEPEPVAASSRPDLGRLRSPARPSAAPQRPGEPVSAEVGFWQGPGGERVTDFDRADELLVDTHRNSAARAGSSFRIPVLRRSFDFTAHEDRLLRVNDSAGNRRKLQALTAAALYSEDTGAEPAALVAAGQFCAPAEPYYQMPVLGEVDRPVRDSLPGMGLERGSITVPAAPVLTDILVDQSGGAIDTLDPSGATGAKTIQEFLTCPSTTTTTLEATTIRLRFDNFNEMTWMERQQAYTALAQISAARHREQRLLTLIDALSTVVTVGVGTLGAYPDVLFYLRNLVSAERDRLRLSTDARFRAYLPRRLGELMAADIARQMPGDGFARYARALAEVTADISAIGLNVTWVWDRDVPAAQGAGGLAVWDVTHRVNIFPEGTFVFGGGQEINLGIVRDSANNEDNTFETFEERFETVFKVGGWPAYALDLTVCPNGATASSQDTSGDCSGS